MSLITIVSMVKNKTKIYKKQILNEYIKKNMEISNIARRSIIFVKNQQKNGIIL